MDRLTFYQGTEKYFDLDRVPYWDGFERLKCLSVHPWALFGQNMSHKDFFAQRSLPQRLEVLVLLFIYRIVPWPDNEITHYAEAVVDQHVRPSSSLRELRLRMCPDRPLSSVEQQHLRELEQRSGLDMTVGEQIGNW